MNRKRRKLIQHDLVFGFRTFFSIENSIFAFQFCFADIFRPKSIEEHSKAIEIDVFQ